MKRDDPPIARRELLLGLGAAALVAADGSPLAAQAASSESTVPTAGLNHIALRVSDLDRSQAFYERHFGLSPISESSSMRFLTAGPHFVALFRSSTPGLDHFCLTAPGYEAQAVADSLRRAGLEPRVRDRRVYVRDPDGLEVQLAAADNWPADPARER